ncbi:MAG: sulfite exporter TauE/SafE family protein [Promethearchaeota archaeon]
MPLGEEFIALTIIFGILIGTISSIVGIGGGILFIPTSIFIFGFPLKDAVVISLFSMTGLNISATFRYIRMKLINYRLAMLYNAWDLPGVIIGAWVTSIITQNLLAGFCGALIILLSIVLFRRKKRNNQENNTNINNENEVNNKNKSDKSKRGKFGVNNTLFASLSSFSGGFISGLGGIGGGTADTTTMILLGVKTKVAAATSQFAMVFTSVFGVIVHVLFGTYTGSLLWPLMMTLGGIIGAQIGTLLISRTRSRIIRKILAVFAFYTGVLLILLMFDIRWY